MSFRCQIFQNRLTFNNVFVKNCDVRLKLIIILCLTACTTTILPIIQCAKLENPQIRLLINDDDLLQEKSNIHEAGSTVHENSGEHFNLYRSELKRLSYETIHRILRDENEPSYRREDTELRYYQKRSPTYEETHQLIKRDTRIKKDVVISYAKINLTEFLITPQNEKELLAASSLDLSDNYLSSLNISCIDKLTHLITLQLSNNSFTSIPLSSQSTLKSLNLNHNLIKVSVLPSNIYLRNLYLSSNHIENLSSIELSLLKNLESLDISFNRLQNTESSFFAERMHNLKHLNLAYNQLGSIYRETFYNLLSLNTLLLSHNNITDIDYETFLALPNLQYLDLSFNSLRGKSIRALQGITGLVALNIAFNPEIGPYMQEFVASWSLKELDASGTGLCQIPAALAQSVRSLKLTHNWLKVINCGDLDSYPLLQYLDLSNSHIEYIEDDALGRLEILEILMLDHNQLKKIPYSLPVSLEHLFLQNNNIMEIPQQAFQGLNNLKTLDLSHNKLMYLPDITLPKLITLNLQAAEIKGINQQIVHTLPKLTDLMLEDNPIKCSDLLGIAEWASTCRLRLDREEEAVEEAEEGELNRTTEETLEIGTNLKDLRKKFEKMHNFYEKFPMKNKENLTLINLWQTPACVKDTLKISVKETSDVEVVGKSLNLITSTLMQKEPLVILENLSEQEQTANNLNKVENFNQNSMISIPATRKTLIEYNKTDADVKNAVKQQQQQQQPENAVKTITQKNYAKTIKEEVETTVVATTMQSSIINEKQIFNTTTKTFNNAAVDEAAATTFPTTPLTIIPTTDAKPQQQVEEQEFVVKPRFTNEMKTFDHSTAATKTMTTTPPTTHIQSAAKDEIASIGNTLQTQSFQNMTKVVEVATTTTTAATKRAKDEIVKTITKTIQKKEVNMKKEEDDGDDDDAGVAKKHVTNLSKETKNDEEITAVLQQESTTFATAINSKQPETMTTTTSMPVETTIKPAEEQQLHATEKPQINLFPEKQQQHEIKTKIATTKEIKSFKTNLKTTTATTIKTPVITTKVAAASVVATNKPTLTTQRMEITTLKTSTVIKANLDKPNKELKEFLTQSSNNNMNTNNINPKHLNITNPLITANNPNTKTTTPSSTTFTTTLTSLNNKDIMTPKTTIISSTTAAILKTSTIEVEQAPTPLPAATAVKDKDLASNYNDNDYNRLTTTTTHSTYTTFANTFKTKSSNMSTSNITNNNTNNKVVVTLDITTPFTNIVHQNDNIFVVDQHQQQHQQQHRHQQQHHEHNKKNVILYQSSQKDVNVKCMQSNSNECNSTIPKRQDEIGKTPTMEATIEMTISSSKTTTVKPPQVATAAAASATTLPVIHKHEPLQLLVKDRHLIGTPLLMHKGENLMVTADELILPTTTNNSHHNHDQDSKEDVVEEHFLNNSNNKSSNNNSNKQHDMETATTEYAKNNKHILDKSQQQYEPKINISNDNNNNKKGQEDDSKQHQQQHQQQKQEPEDHNIFKKTNFEMKTKKPSLIMKKMTIITKQHEQPQHGQHQQHPGFHQPEPKENEIHPRTFDDSHYQELKPIIQKQTTPESLQNIKHSTVNTPTINKQANLLKEPHTFQHEHDLLIQQILQDQQAETHDKFSKTEQWSDLRKGEMKENHPGIILLVSSGLFLVLLLGLMHVYRCDMPWRRNSPVHHLRPHQRQTSSIEDDSHSFLSYNEGMQKWHHSARLEAPYNSPLHNLHVRELQKTSATDKPATVKSYATSFKQPIRSNLLMTTRSLSQSSATTSSSTASPSSSAILDDEAFYIEMTPDSGQMASALQSELLPMELLNMAQSSQDYKETIVDATQTSMEEFSMQHHLQPDTPHDHLTPFNSTSDLPTSACSASSFSSSSANTTSFNLKPHSNPRKFALW